MVDNKENRKSDRLATELPVSLGTAKGRTRDVSPTGIFFETDSSYVFGSTISFSVELDTPTGKMMLKCQGEIVRIEPRLERVGVAVKITQSVMVPVS